MAISFNTLIADYTLARTHSAVTLIEQFENSAHAIVAVFDACAMHAREYREANSLHHQRVQLWC
jgi:F0F1-type ATP synthase alpha subunit